MILEAKRMAKSLLRRLGYEVRRMPKSVTSLDHAAALTVKEAQYYTQWSAPCPLFTPWVGHPDFSVVYEGVAPHTVVSPDRCYVLVGLARYAKYLAGEFAECGVYRGGTALLLARVLQNTRKRLYLFDSFRGLPMADRAHDTHYGEGDFGNVSLESVKWVLKGFEPIVDIRPGWIPETFGGLENERYAFVHVDVDLYQSALDCCRYFYPRLVPGGVVVFDEYGFAATRGEKDAVDEFFTDKRELPLTLPTGQGIVIKLPPPDS